MIKNEQLHFQLTDLIQEFKSPETYMRLFVDFEQPQYQRNLYQFWCQTIDKIIENIFETSLIQYKDLDNLFCLFKYKPICLMKILQEMHKNELIILVNNQDKQQIIDYGLQILQNEYHYESTQKKGLMLTWNNISKFFQIKKPQTKAINKNIENFKYCFIHINQLNESIQKFKLLVECTSRETFNTFTIAQLLEETTLTQKEIEFLLEIFMRGKLIEKIGFYKIGNKRTEVYIYHSLWQVQVNTFEMNKNCVLFKLTNYEKKLQKDVDEYNNKIADIENRIKQKIRQGKKPQDIKFEILSKKGYDKQTQLIQNKILTIQQNLIAVNSAEFDQQFSDILSKVNDTISNFNVDPILIKEGLEQLQDAKFDQDQINDLLTNYNDDTELEQIYQSYVKEVKEDPLQVAQQQQQFGLKQQQQLGLNQQQFSPHPLQQNKQPEQIPTTVSKKPSIKIICQEPQLSRQSSEAQNNLLLLQE